MSVKTTLAHKASRDVPPAFRSGGWISRTDGQKAPIVNPDGTVTVNVVKDPAAILIRATGDIDVNKSRIATFGGGDIRLTSVQGNINAGSGSKNERVQYRGRCDRTG